MNNLMKAIVLLIGSTCMLVACGGGGGSSTPPVAATEISVSGVASKGSISGGTITAFKIENGVLGAQLVTTPASPVTAADGSFTIKFNNYSGPLRIQVADGSYMDESTGNIIPLANPLRAYVGKVTAKTATVALTPLTELAAKYADSTYPGTLNQATINSANNIVSTDFGITDILTILPSASSALPTNSQTPTYTQSQEYTRLLVAISRLSTGASPPKSVDQLLRDYSNNTVGLATLVASSKTTPIAMITASSTSGTVTGTAVTPLRVVAETSPQLAFDPPSNISFAVTGPGLIKYPTDTNYVTNLVVSTWGQFTVYPAKAPVDMKCTGVGAVTIKATYTTGSVGSVTINCTQ